MSSEPIVCEMRGPVALLTLNRPDTRNALSGEEVFAAFEQVFERLNADMTVRAAVLTGAGSAFCSGGNVAEMRDRTGMFGGKGFMLNGNMAIGTTAKGVLVVE